MGNSQSTARNMRLTKPNTSVDSHVATVVVETPGSFSSRYDVSNAKGRQRVRETSLCPSETGFDPEVVSTDDHNRTGESGSHPRGRPSSATSRSNSRTNSRSNSLSCFGSRQGSIAKLGDLQEDDVAPGKQSIDMNIAIRLLQEVKKNASPEDLATLRKLSTLFVTALRLELVCSPSKKSLVISSVSLRGVRPPSNHQHALTPIITGEALEYSDHALATEQETTHPTPVASRSSLSLSRRRSWVQTPGVATRGPQSEGRRRTWNSWKDPQLPPEEEAKWIDTSHSKSYVNRLATVDAAEEGRITPTPRAQTPGEMDYGHLGTLSIVNGAPSPAASTRTMPERDATPASRVHTMSRSLALSRAVLEEIADDSTSLPSVQSTTPELHPTYMGDLNPVPGAKQDLEEYQAPALESSDGANKAPTVRGKESGDFESKKISPLRQQAVHLLAGTVNGPPTVTVTSARTKKPKTGFGRPTPRKADSGYSSAGSPGSTERTTYVFRSRYYASTQSSPSTPTSIADSQLVTTLVSPGESTRSSTSDSVASSKALSSSASSLDKTKSTTPRRLQKRRPSQPELPVTQLCHTIPEGTIPRPSESVRSRFTRRLSDSPGVECLTHTYPNRDHVSVADADSGTSPVSVAPAQAVAKTTELESKRPMLSVHRRSKSFSLFRRKSFVPDEEKEEEKTLSGAAHLDTLPSSLGNSPYDAALNWPLRQTDSTLTHPHQLGGGRPPVSAVHMNDKEAVEFARLHSMDRKSSEGEITRPRRKSIHHTKSETDVGEARVSKRRPRYSLQHIPPQNIPPVPSIDISRIAIAQSHDEPRKESPQNCSSSVRSSVQVVHQLEREHGQTQQSAPHYSVDWEAHSQTWAQRRKTIAAGASAAGVPVTDAGNVPHPRVENLASWGRYSGGLGYEYEGRGVGIGGSMGTRQLHSSASTKSMHWRNQYGVDLSDVPIMLQRV